MWNSLDDINAYTLRLLPQALSTSAAGIKLTLTIDQGVCAMICKLLLQIKIYRKTVYDIVFSSHNVCLNTLCHFR